jgi:hypothetical protein
VRQCFENTESFNFFFLGQCACLPARKPASASCAHLFLQRGREGQPFFCSSSSQAPGMQRLLLAACAAAPVLGGTFTSNTISLYSPNNGYSGSNECATGADTVDLDTCTQLPNLQVYSILTCSPGASSYTLSFCTSSDCTTCASVQGNDNGQCNALPSPSQGYGYEVNCGVLSPLSIALIVVAALILLCLLCSWCCNQECCCGRSRGAREEVVLAEALLSASRSESRSELAASQLRVASAQARVDAQALKLKIARLEAELLAARLTQARRAPSPPQAQARRAPSPPQALRGGAAAAGAAEEAPPDGRQQVSLQWTHPRIQ